MDPKDPKPKPPDQEEWHEADRLVISRLPEGQKARRMLRSRLDLVASDLVGCCMPAGYTGGAGPNGEMLRVTSEEKREQSVYKRGFLDAVRQVLAEFFEGDE